MLLCGNRTHSRAASGRAAAAPLMSVMNARRFMCGWPPWQEKMQRAAQKSLAVMCPACSRSPDGLLALMESANRASSLERDRCPNEAAGFARLRRNDRLCHHASLLSRKLQRQDREAD